jgi:hypothetical protein
MQGWFLVRKILRPVIEEVLIKFQATDDERGDLSDSIYFIRNVIFCTCLLGEFKVKIKIIYGADSQGDPYLQAVILSYKE